MGTTTCRIALVENEQRIRPGGAQHWPFPCSLIKTLPNVVPLSAALTASA
jgi:hypothetical protein